MERTADELISVARQYLAAIERGDLDAMLGVFDPEALQIEYPNRLKAKGDRRGLERMAADFGRGRQLLRSQRYEVLGATATGTTVALEVLWTGELAVPLGPLKVGETMSAHSAMFFEFRDGRILVQRNYDCFEDFLAAA